MAAKPLSRRAYRREIRHLCQIGAQPSRRDIRAAYRRYLRLRLWAAQ